MQWGRDYPRLWMPVGRSHREPSWMLAITQSVLNTPLFFVPLERKKKSTTIICYQVLNIRISNLWNAKVWKKWVSELMTFKILALRVRYFKIIKLIPDNVYWILHLGLEYCFGILSLLHLGHFNWSHHFIPSSPDSPFSLNHSHVLIFCWMLFGNIVLVWMLVSSLCLFLWFKSLYY